ncbi:hypothetical protein [Thaumasiovibrio sp. DFM-14]|uniref:hypothetical protein n=1 Tax=Thaumasiovibrio sp. DFM-14 TaxID=3384792 RepID=UPI0039A36A7D
MLLEQAVEIIDYTDSDTLVQAMETYNEKGIVSGAQFPFLNAVFDSAPAQLIECLSAMGDHSLPLYSGDSSNSLKNT